MTVNQLSIFLEKRSGTLTKVLDIMKRTGIRIIASTIADTAQYGLFRVICSNPRQAYLELVNEGFAVAMSDVFAIEMENRPGQTADTVKCFSEAGISIIYMYSLLKDGKGILLFRTDDMETAREVIHRAGFKCVSEKDLADWK